MHDNHRGRSVYWQFCSSSPSPGNQYLPPITLPWLKFCPPFTLPWFPSSSTSSSFLQDSHKESALVNIFWLFSIKKTIMGNLLYFHFCPLLVKSWCLRIIITYEIYKSSKSQKKTLQVLSKDVELLLSAPSSTFLNHIRSTIGAVNEK